MKRSIEVDERPTKSAVLCLFAGWPFDVARSRREPLDKSQVRGKHDEGWWKSRASTPRYYYRHREYTFENFEDAF